MSKLSDMFRMTKPAPREDGAPAPDPKALAEAASDPVFDPEVKGHDSRRLAEIQAELVGRRWRAQAEAKGEVAREVGGPKGLEPTRYGDWEKAGRCIDF